MNSENELSRFAQGDDLDYIVNYVTAANKGVSRSFIGREVITSLILSLRDTNERIKALEDAHDQNRGS